MPRSRWAAGVAAGAGALLLAWPLVFTGVAGDPSSPGGPGRRVCAPGDGFGSPGNATLAGWAPAGGPLRVKQVANTRAVAAAAPGPEAALIAVSVILVEANGLNLASRRVPESLGFPNDGVAEGDLDSVGLFQQRAVGWGSLAERMNPPTAAASFYAALQRVPGWQRLDPGVAAQRVQRSAYPTRYSEEMNTARALLAEASTTPGMVPVGYRADGGDYPGLGPVQPVTVDVARVVGRKHGIRTVGGYRDAAGEQYDPAGHPAGLALDFMTDDIPGGRGTGQALADYVTGNAAAFAVKYVIWEQRIWSAERAGEGWRVMPDRGSPTQNHMDHVHVSLNPGGKVTVPADNPGPAVPGGVVGCDTVPASFQVPAPAVGGGVVVGGRAAPVPGAHQGWGSYPGHTGLDYAVPTGTPVGAWQAGVVTAVRHLTVSFGVHVVVSHPGGVESIYAHLSEAKVGVGQPVPVGGLLGLTGDTGNSTGPHLHFEVREGGVPVNPVGLLP